MSNYIRGTINSGTMFLIVGRTVVSEDKIYYGTYMTLNEQGGKSGFFGSLMDYKESAQGKYVNLKPVAFTHSKQSDTGMGFAFSRVGLLNGLETIDENTLPVPIISSLNDLGTVTAFTEYTKSVATKTPDPEFLYLHPNLPLDQRLLFAGAWYSISDKNDNVLQYNWFNVAPKVVNGFNAGVVEEPATSLLKTDIMFVPFTYYGWKVINGKYKALDGASDFMKYVDGWIKGDSSFDQVGCEGALNQNDTNNCIFTLGDIKGLAKTRGFGYGWRYCNNGESCADGCFGKCEEHINKDSEYCNWSSFGHRFVCGTDPADTGENFESKSNNVHWFKIVLIIVFVLILLGAISFFVWRHNR